MEEDDDSGGHATRKSPRVSKRKKHDEPGDSSRDSSAQKAPVNSSKRKRVQNSTTRPPKKQHVGFKCAPSLLYDFLKQLNVHQRTWVEEFLDAKTVLRFLLLGTQDASLTVDYCESVLRQDFENPMTPDQRNGFRVAAVIYSMAKYLAVNGGSIRFPFEILPSLLDPFRLRCFNWAGYIRMNLLQEACSVQNQIISGRTKITVGGCSAYMMVHMLDNLNVDTKFLPDNSFPRATIFSQQVVDHIIMMDTHTFPHSTNRTFGRLKFKPSHEVCYTRYKDVSTPAKPVEAKRLRELSDEEKYKALEVSYMKRAVSSRGNLLSVGRLTLKARDRMIGKHGVSRKEKGESSRLAPQVQKERSEFDIIAEIIEDGEDIAMSDLEIEHTQTPYEVDHLHDISPSEKTLKLFKMVNRADNIAQI